MRAVDESALICDFQEFYHLDFEECLKNNPLRTATLACGLRADARIIKKVGNLKASTEELLLADISDKLTLLLWQRGGAKGAMPTLLTKQIVEGDKPKAKSFSSRDNFKNWREKFKKE